MDDSKGRLCLAPDDYSGSSPVGKCTQTSRWPHGYPDAANIWRGAGSTHNHYEGADMQKSTRGPAPDDSRTPLSGVKITPPVQRRGPVTTTHTAA